ncbi:MAG: hypothetical protein ACKOFU_07425 [Actinomycetota bacterium]
MLEFFLIGALIGVFLMRRKQKKLSLDAELQELIASAGRTKESAEAIRAFLLRVIADERNEIESFNDSQLAEAKRIIEKIGPGAFFWMTHIATQLAFLSAAQINGIPTNVNAELGDAATAEDVVRIVVQV